MKNKCSNKIALRSGNSPYIIACSIPHQTNTLAHNTHTHALSHSDNRSDVRVRNTVEVRWQHRQRQLWRRWRKKTDGILNFVSILAIYFYLVGIFPMCPFVYLLLLSFIHLDVLLILVSLAIRSPFSLSLSLSRAHLSCAAFPILAVVFHFVLWSTLHIKMKWVGKMIG